jgi:hypothetical protein
MEISEWWRWKPLQQKAGDVNLVRHRLDLPKTRTYYAWGNLLGEIAFLCLENVLR